MPIQIKCACGRTINVLDELAGRQAHCIYCGATVAVPGTAVATPAAAAPVSFHLLPPILDHLNIARRMHGATPRTMTPALKHVIDLAMRLLVDHENKDPELQNKALDEITAVVREGPVAAGYVVRSSFKLSKPGRDPAPAAVVFSTDPATAFDVGYLESVGKKVIEVGHTRRNPRIAPVQGPFDDEHWDGCLELPPAVNATARTWLGAMMVDPTTLPKGHLEVPFVAGIACPRLKYFKHASMLSI